MEKQQAVQADGGATHRNLRSRPRGSGPRAWPRRCRWYSAAWLATAKRSRTTRSTPRSPSLGQARFTERIGEADDEDRFGFEAGKGEKLRLRLRASEFNSALDPVLCIEDAKGKQLARDDDSGERQDAMLNWTVPADGTYHLAVSDLIRSGSNAHFYRLEIDRVTPGLNASFTPDRLVLEAGKSAGATVTIGFADGYKGNPCRC